MQCAKKTQKLELTQLESRNELHWVWVFAIWASYAYA